jgi:hypothetical protein
MAFKSVNSRPGKALHRLQNSLQNRQVAEKAMDLLFASFNFLTEVLDFNDCVYELERKADNCNYTGGTAERVHCRGLW